MVPEQYKMLSETSRAARLLYSRDNAYLKIGDHLDALILPINIAQLDPTNRLSMVSCIRLALVTAFQLEEVLPDDLAVKAAINRLDWKYALDLPIEHLGIDEMDLRNFRADLVESPEGLTEFGILLDSLKRIGFFKGRSEETLTPGSALDFLDWLNVVHLLQQTLLEAFTVLTQKVPDQFKNLVPAEIYARYANQNFLAANATQEELNAAAHQIGEDVYLILHFLRGDANNELMTLDEISNLQILFDSHFSMNFGVLGLRELPKFPLALMDSKEVHYRKSQKYNNNHNGTGRMT